MKKLTGIIILIIISLWACRLEELGECGEATTFERTYNEAADFEARDIAATGDGGHVICGNVGNDIFLMKIDEQGDVIFYEQDIISGTDETCRSIVVTSDGGFLICGEQESKAYFATFNSLGEHLNQSTKNQRSSCQCINKTNDGRYIFAGGILNANVNKDNAYVGRIDINNTYPAIVDEYIPNPPRDKGEYAFSVIDAGDSYAVAGRSLNQNDPIGGLAAHFFRLDKDLMLVSEAFHDLSEQSDAAHDIVQTDEGNFILTGNMELVGLNAFALKVNKDGVAQKLNQYGGQYRDIGNAIIKTNDNKYVIAGVTGENLGPAVDVIYNVYLIKINEDGSIVWERTYGQQGINELASSVLQTDCGYIIVGTSRNSSGIKPYVIKVDIDGNVL